MPRTNFLFSLCFTLMLLVGFGNSFEASAQRPDDEITVNTLNPKYLEHLIKVGIDSVRRELGLTPLVNDSILYVAAKDHAEYLKRTRNFSHFEDEIANKRTPQLRAQYHGAKDYLVGENIIKSYLGKKMKNKRGREYVNRTYADIAYDFVDGWVHSPPHYENIKTPDWQITGVSISIDRDRKQVFGVQKFAKVVGQYAFEENAELFSWSEYTPPAPITSFDQVERKPRPQKFAWNLRSPKDSVKFCASCNDAIDSSLVKGRLERKKNNFYFHSPDVEMMFDLTRGAKDGLALEFVSYEPFDCGNPAYYTQPSRRNRQSILNGEVTEPKYRKELKKGFKRKKYKWFYRNRNRGTAKSFSYKLGKAPKDLASYYEVNVLVIKGGRVCRTIHYTDVCGEPYPDSLSRSLQWPDESFVYVSQPVKQVMDFKIPFEKGKSEYSYADVAPYLGFLNETDFTLDSARIRAFSSVEGTQEINERLQRERSEAVLNVFDSLKTTGFTSTVVAKENWALFFQQLAADARYDDWEDLTKAQIKSRIDDPAIAAEMEPLLQAQREAEVRLHLHYTIPDAFLADTLVRDFSRYFTLVDDQWVGPISATDTLLKMQYRIFELIQAGHAHEGHLQQIEKYQLALPGLAEQQVYLKYRLGLYNDESPSTKLLEDLAQAAPLARHPQITALNAIQLALQFLATKDELVIPAMQLDSLVNGLAANLSKVGSEAEQNELALRLDTLQSLKEIYLAHYHRVNGPHRNDNALRTHCEALTFQTLRKRVDTAELQRRALFLVYHSQNDLALELLMAYRAAGSQSFETLALEARLGYSHIEEYGDTAYYQHLIELAEELDQTTWCGLFVGDCNISFQVFDFEPLRKFYCQQCKDHENAAQKWLREQANGVEP